MLVPFALHRLRTACWTSFYRVFWRFFFSSLGQGCKFEGWVDIPQWGGKIIIGSNVRICRGVELSVPKGGRFLLGDGSMLSRGCLLSAHGEIKIGESVMLAEYVFVHDNDHEFRNSDQKMIDQGMIVGAIAIDSNVWIGANSIILRGATIGSGSVVGAGAIVKGHHPGGSLIVGQLAQSRSLVKKHTQ